MRFTSWFPLLLALWLAPHSAQAESLLITGATGGIGRNLLYRLLTETPSRYEHIAVVVRNPGKLIEQLAKDGIEQLPPHVSIRAMKAPDWDFSMFQVDHVIHASGVLFGPDEDRHFFPTNVDGTLAMLRTLRGNPRIVILSSLAAAGPTAVPTEPRQEADEDLPITPYGRSKLEMERRVLEECGQANCVFLRPAVVLGPRESETERLLDAARSLPVFFKNGFGTKHISFISIDDLNEAALRLLASHIDFRSLNPRHLHVNSQDKVTTDRMFHSAQKVTWGREMWIAPVAYDVLRLLSWAGDRFPIVGAHLPPSFSSGRVVDLFQNGWTSCSDRIRELLNWEPTATLESTLQEARDVSRYGRRPRK